jgi:UDP-N-acetylmuramate dehydrogenase
VPAGWLIEKAGLKGYTQRGVKVSEKHANFLVNIGTGNAEAVKELAESVKTLVHKQFGVELEEEVEILG